MDFGALPPEVNSGRMYAGPGSGPMLVASAAWDGLAADLHSTAASYGSVISGLTGGSWLGPASTSMAAAAAPYVAWMSATATQAEQTGAQAKAAASAYEAAFAMTVPPPVIAANRAQLAALVATNLLGQNTAAIAATEAHYGEMWAQDAAAMYGYAGASASASTLTPFTPPKPTTNPAGPPVQAAAVAQAAGTSAGSHAQTLMSSLSTVPQTLQGLAQPLQSTSSTSGLPQLMSNGASLASSGAYAPANALSGLTGASGTGALKGASKGAGVGAGTASGLAAALNGNSLGIIEDTAGFGIDAAGFLGPEAGGAGVEVASSGVEFASVGSGEGLGGFGAVGPLPGLGGLGPVGGFGGAGASASTAQAASLGGLSVPQAWTAAAPAIRLAAVASPATSLSAPPEVFAASPGSLFSEMALANMAGRAVGSTASQGRRDRTLVTTWERAESPQRPPGSPGSVAELRQLTEALRELAALRDSGILTDEEFNEQKRRLLGH